jgi:hypothetical protein
MLPVSLLISQWSAQAAAEAGFQTVGKVRLEARLSAMPALAIGDLQVVLPPPRTRQEVEVASSGAAQPPAQYGGSGYGEYLILRALRLADSALARCWERANRSAATPLPRKAQLTLAVDSSGAVQTARVEVADGGLPACVAAIGRRLPFPATGKPMTLQILLLF